MRKMLVFALVVVSLLLGATVEAQIVGTVVDQEYNPIPWAVVNASTLQTNGVRQYVGWAWADSDGRFTLYPPEWFGWYVFPDGEYLLEVDAWDYKMERVPVIVSYGYGDAGETQLSRSLSGVGVNLAYNMLTRTIYWTVFVNGQVPTSPKLTTKTLVGTPAKTESFTQIEMEQPRFPVPTGKYLNTFQIPAQIPDGTYICGWTEISRTGDRLNILSNNHGWCVLIRSDAAGKRHDVAWTRSGMASWKQLQ